MRSIFAFFLAASVLLAQPRNDVVLTQVAMRDLPGTATLVGTVEPRTRSLVGTEIAGIVVAMQVRQGDRVTKGDVLVELDTRKLELQLSEANARVEAAKAQVKRWTFEMQWVRDLHGDNQAGRMELYRTEADLAVAEQSVRERQSIVDQLQTDLAKSRIVAPFDGFVVARHTEVGEWLDRGGGVVEIVDLSTVLVRIDVHERAIPFVRQGDSARVHVGALDRIFEGTIRHVIRQADPAARTFPVEIEVDNSGNELAAGMFVRATVTAGSSESVVAVPKDAIFVMGGVEYVGLVMPGQHGGTNGFLKPVTTGKDINDWIAITSNNLTAGMDVVIRGNERLLPFPAPVRVVDEFGTPIEMTPPDKSASPSDGAHSARSTTGSSH